MLLKYILNILGIVSFILASVGYFYWAYSKLNLEPTAYCIMSWAFVVVSYKVVVYLITLVLMDLDI